MKKVVIIHTTPVTIPSMKNLILERRKDVEIINFLDDSMLSELNSGQGCIEGVKYRLNTLLTMAATTGADALLCACSSIGGLLDEGKELVQIPVMRIDQPMAEKAACFSRVGVAATLQSTIQPTCALIEKLAAENGKSPVISSRVIEGAGSLLAEGREEEYDRMVAAVLNSLAEENEVVVLAQASMARVLDKIPEEARGRFLTSPVSGVESFLSKL